MAKRQYLYRDYVRTLSERFEANLSYIQHVYNFDVGDEFEVAICQTLRSALPQKFGICRGHVVDAQGNEEGDDILIYDRLRFPTLRLLPGEDYSRKEWVPIEAVYAYIEAKHSLTVEGQDGAPATITKACQQIDRVKSLCRKRDAVPLTKPKEDFPRFQNPLFAAILARRLVRKKGAAPFSTGLEIRGALSSLDCSDENPPDLIVIGQSNVITPTEKGDGKRLGAGHVFFENGLSLGHVVAEGVGFGIGLCNLMAALDFIELGPMPWPLIFNDAFDLPEETVW
jgi:hypothetical protein